VLETQKKIREFGPEEFQAIQLITPEELHEIRRIWLYEKHEFDDALPRVYQEVVGEPFSKAGIEGHGLQVDDWEVLREVCGDDVILFDLQVALLGVERQFRGMTRRAGIYDALEERLRVGLFGSEQEAVEVLSERLREREATSQAGVLRVSLPIVETPPAGEDEG
jgi:DNA sulfur modification protein DndC